MVVPPLSAWQVSGWWDSWDMGRAAGQVIVRVQRGYLARSMGLAISRYK